MDTLYAAFVNWQKELDGESDFWGLRYIRPGDGGLIWRNAAACEYFQQFGFFPAATAPWSGVQQWLGPLESARLQTIYELAFQQMGQPITDVVKATASVSIEASTVFTAVMGTARHGLILTHYELLAVCETSQAPPVVVACN